MKMFITATTFVTAVLYTFPFTTQYVVNAAHFILTSF